MLPARTAALLGVLIHTASVSAGEYQDALDAFNAGNYQRAGELWQRCASAGQAPCQYGLGVLYDEGHDRPRDFTRALHWYRRAALNGSRDAQIQLGFIYATGRGGIRQSPLQAFVWFSVAANNGARDAARYRDRVARHLSTAERTEAHRQIDALGIQYHLQPE